jgi:hypothetical protein
MKAALFVIPFAVLFAASAFAQELSVAAAQSACGPSDTQFSIKTTAGASTLQQPDSGKAVVYVIEEQKFKAIRDVTARVGLDGAWVGANRGNSYFFFSVDPGEHHLCTDWISDFVPNGRLVSLTPLSAEAGQTYFFRVRTSGGRGSMAERSTADGALIDLDLVNNDEGKLLVASSSLSVSHPKK